MVPESNRKQRGETLSKRLSILCVLTAAGLWGSTGIFVRALTGYGLTSIQITTGRTVFGLIIVAAFLFFKDRRMFRIHPKDLGWFAANGILSILFLNLCYITTIQLSDMAVAAILLYTSPIFVIIISILLFRERMTIRKGISLVLAFTGCALVSGLGSHGSAIPMAALVFGLGSGFGYALYSIFSRILVKRYHSLTIVLYTFAFTVLAAICLTDVRGIFTVYAMHPQAVGVHILAGICTNSVPYILYTYALMHMEASRASMLASIEPVVAALLGLLVFKETLPLTSLIGIGCILIMIVLLSKGDK